MPLQQSRDRTKLILYLLLFLYVIARFLHLFSERVPSLLIVLLHVLPPAAFAFVHGKVLYRTRAMVVFIVLCMGVGSFFETMNLRTGFPFGRYFFTGLMGPKLFQLPILLVFAYVGMGYLSWIVGMLILGSPARALSGNKVFLHPLIASFVMVAWDLAMDPVWTNIDYAWVWKNGGGYFGVPLTNFFGWFLTVYIIYQAFAIYLRNRAFTAAPRDYYRLAIFFYAISAAGNLLQAIPSYAGLVVNDARGNTWRVSDIVGGSILISVFVMEAFALIAWARLTAEDLPG
jgi:putative membrane protein